jgi:hypothetical protein
MLYLKKDLSFLGSKESFNVVQKQKARSVSADNTENMVSRICRCSISKQLEESAESERE